MNTQVANVKTAVDTIAVTLAKLQETKTAAGVRMSKLDAKLADALTVKPELWELYSAWRSAGMRSMRANSKNLWKVADWLDHGLSTFSTAYKTAFWKDLAELGYQKQTASNYALTFRTFQGKPAYRLTFSHHVHLTPLYVKDGGKSDRLDELVHDAITKPLTSNQVQARVKELLHPNTNPKPLSLKAINGKMALAAIRKLIPADASYDALLFSERVNITVTFVAKPAK